MARPELPDRQLRRIRALHVEAKGYEAKSSQEALATMQNLAEAAIEEGLHIDLSRFIASLPEELAQIVTSVRSDFLVPEYRYRPSRDESEDRSLLTMVSRETEKPIIRIGFYYPTSGRTNHRIDFSYRTPQGQMSLVARLRESEKGFISVKYREPDSGDMRENTRKPGDVRELIRESLSEYATEAWEKWGRDYTGEASI